MEDYCNHKSKILENGSWIVLWDTNPKGPTELNYYFPTQPKQQNKIKPETNTLEQNHEEYNIKFHLIYLLMPWRWISVWTSKLKMSQTEGIDINTGLFSREHITVPIWRVEAVDVKRSLLGRILGYGDVTITNSGRTFTFHCVKNPNEVREVFNKLLRQK